MTLLVTMIFLIVIPNEYPFRPYSKIVLVAIQDEGSNYVKSALDALKRLGATDPVLPDFRGSFALVGYAGVNKPSWITQKTAKRGLGPSEISLKIPLIPQPH